MILTLEFEVQDDKSSAKSPISTLSDFVSEISLKKRLKSVGPKTLPWGTPAFINFFVEKSVKKEILHVNIMKRAMKKEKLERKKKVCL